MKVIAGKLDAWEKKCEQLSILPPKDDLKSPKSKNSKESNQMDLVGIDK